MFEPFGLTLSMLRNDPQYSYIHKFGSNLALAGTPESVWSAGGLYPWSSLASAQTLYVLSTDGGDTGTLTIQGLDSNYDPLTETVTLTGVTAVTTTNQFLRVFRMEYSATNAGTITARVTNGTGTIVAQVDIGAAQTLMAVYTIPRQKTGFLMNYTASTGKGDDASVDLYIRDPAINGFRLKSQTKIYQSSFRQEFTVPLVLQEKSDIDFRATTTNANSDCIINFDVVILSN
ncbi:MAG: hypothetical protein VW518_02080 [Burkholderiaceae bacterium]